MECARRDGEDWGVERVLLDDVLQSPSLLVRNRNSSELKNGGGGQDFLDWMKEPKKLPNHQLPFVVFPNIFSSTYITGDNSKSLNNMDNGL